MLRMEDELVKPCIYSEDGRTEVTIAPMDIEPFVDEQSKMMRNPDKGEIIASGGDTDAEPYEGMEFESEEAARTFYAAYAKHVGFRIRISRYTRSRRDNSIISRRIVCSKEGFREARANEGLSGERRQRQRAATRVGCKAMIMVKKMGPEKWIVTKFEKEHNHGPVPPRKVEVRTVRRNDDFLVQSYISDGGAVQEPFEGMEFESEEAAKTFYIAYASHMGFRARISKYCRSRRDNSIISRQIVCSKEGFREVRVKNEITDEGKTKRPRVITRIGCKAMIIVKKANSGKWIVTKFEKEHNHALTSLKMPHLESHSNAGKVINLQGAIAKPNGMVTDESCAGTQGTSRESLTVLYNQFCYEAIK
uniref:Protein FAR1-RELATED SEQUENCE 7 n=1 Tax=Elaeis guineensis var. tenera TaxID=51953 RepID=A0A6J0PB26_ELAGV|nr:protein FAR1-RELATED SEQUENCE 7 [Elaeis guineensis]